MKVERSLMGFLIGLVFLASLPVKTCAEDHLSLTGQEGEDGSALRLHCAVTVWAGEPWRIFFTAALPEEIANDDPAYAGLTLIWTGDDWRWLIATRTSFLAEKSLGALQIRGDFDRGAWAAGFTLGELDLSEPAAEEGLAVEAAYRAGRHWRFSLAEEYAEVTTAVTGETYRRYETEAAATWRNGGAWCRMALGGRATQAAEAIDDTRTLYAELDWRYRLDERWTLAGDLHWKEREEAADFDDGNRIGLELTRRAPLGLRLQTDFTADDDGDEWRYGCTLSGSAEMFRWRAGIAGKSGEAADGEAWAYAVLGWVWPDWELKLGLTPKGEYAVNSRQGYWATVSWYF